MRIACIMSTRAAGIPQGSPVVGMPSPWTAPICFAACSAMSASPLNLGSPPEASPGTPEATLQQQASTHAAGHMRCGSTPVLTCRALDVTYLTATANEQVPDTSQLICTLCMRLAFGGARMSTGAVGEHDASDSRPCNYVWGCPEREAPVGTEAGHTSRKSCSASRNRHFTIDALW